MTKQTAESGRAGEPRSYAPKKAAPEKDGPEYRTDTFSRNDREGLPANPSKADLEGESGAETAPRLAAGDDRDSRDARPPSAEDGGAH